MKMLIKNGTIVTPSKRYKSDILISNGKINHIDSKISTPEIDKVIDAKGCFVFPGGIDPHVHMHLPSQAGYSSDDFLTGSRAALFGGTTTLLDFVTPKKGESLTKAFRERKEEAKNSLVDYSFHMSIIELRDTTEQEIDACIKEGVTSFKLYMAYRNTIGLNDRDILKVMKVVGRTGKLVTVHCESGDEIDILRNNFFNEHKIEPGYHPLSRPADLEAVAVKRIIDLAKQANCSVYIVHVSSKESINHIHEAQRNGQKIFAETCPQYLLLDDSRYVGDFAHTAPYIISPPLRKKEDNEALWNAINKGIVNTVGTDHCPFNMAQKEAGLNDFRKIPNGGGGVEHRLPLLYTFGVMENRITLNQMVDVFSTQPAEIFGLSASKGNIKVGSDADLVIWNPDPENTISSKTHHQSCDINMFEGVKTRGVAEFVVVGGKVVIEKGNMTDSGTRGKFIKR